MRMNIVVLNESDEVSWGMSISRALKSLGHSVELIDPWRLLQSAYPRTWRLRLRAREVQTLDELGTILVPQVCDRRPDLIIVGKGAWALPQTLLQIRKELPYSLLTCFNTDDPVRAYSRGSIRPWITACIKYYDLFCFYKPDFEEAIRGLGAKNFLYLPFAFDALYHQQAQVGARPDRTSDIYRRVLFIGNGDDHRFREISQLLPAFQARGLYLDLYGYWPRRFRRRLGKSLLGSNMPYDQTIPLIQSYPLSLNILRQQNVGYHNMRTFEVPGIGGINLSYPSKGQDCFFPPGKASLVYKTPEDAAHVVDAVIDDHVTLAELTSCAQSTAKAHTYTHRAIDLMEAIFNL